MKHVQFDSGFCKHCSFAVDRGEGIDWLEQQCDVAIFGCCIWCCIVLMVPINPFADNKLKFCEKGKEIKRLTCGLCTEKKLHSYMIEYNMRSLSAD